MQDPAVDCDHLVKQFGPTCALHDVSVRVPVGEVWALTGDNGSGKSTLLRLAAGVMDPTQGTVRVLGARPDPRSLETGGHVSYLPQGVTFSRTLTTRDIVAFAAHRKQLPSSAADEALAAMEILGLADLCVGMLPHHATKRLALAVALMGTPDVVLLDEPTECLDPRGRQLLCRRLRERPATQTVLLATPLPGDLEPAIDVIVTMDDGRVVETHRLTHAPPATDANSEKEVGQALDLAR